MAGPYRIHEARLSDLDAAARVRAECWRESFTGVLPDEVIANTAAWAPAVAERWAATMIDRGATFWLGVDAAGAIVAVAHADAALEPGAPATLELKTLYVLDAAKGSGLADALLHRAIGEDVPAYLWVIDGNERAVTFYERHGFEADGETRPIEPGWPGGVQLRMVRREADDASH